MSKCSRMSYACCKSKVSGEGLEVVNPLVLGQRGDGE